jgi:hypothetical protein
MRTKGGKYPLSLGLQVLGMRQRFPDFRFEHKTMSWYGSLQPSDESPDYRIKITYRVPRNPQVWVLRPSIDPRAKHRYNDGSLCLHYPPDGDWHPGYFIANTIVPWTAEWLCYYEAWQVDPEQRWFGREAPHPLNPRRKRPNQ